MRVLTASGDTTARIWDAETGDPLFSMAGLPDSWAVLDANLNVRRMGPNAWKYVYSLFRDGDGRLRVGSGDAGGR